MIFRYTNPIIRDRALALRDHFILKNGGRWYLTGTSLPIWGGANPGVRLLVSDDLLHWRQHSWLIDAATLPADCFYNGRFWAPEIHRAHGRYWLTVNSGHQGPEHGERRLDGHGIVLFVADTITGPYRLVTREGPIGRGFKNDANLFTDAAGESYLYASGGGLSQGRIDLETGRLTNGDDLQKICSPGDAGNPDWMIGGIEGPYVMAHDGAYWMFFSAWTRGYETARTQSSRRSTVKGRITLPYSDCLKSPRRRSATAQIKAERLRSLMREVKYENRSYHDGPELSNSR